MEIVLITLMVVVCFNYILKQTYRKWFAVLFSAAVASVFILVSWPFAIEQSKTQISGWLQDSVLMKDMAVVLSIDVMVQLAFCMTSAHLMNSGRLEKKIVRAYKVLRWIPSILFYPVLFYALVTLMFSIHGMEFSTIAWLMAGGVFIAIPGLTWLLRFIIPEKDLRLEILFLCNVLILLMGVVSTVNGQTAVAGTNSVNWASSATVAGIIIIGALAGYSYWKFKSRKNIKS